MAGVGAVDSPPRKLTLEGKLDYILSRAKRVDGCLIAQCSKDASTGYARIRHKGERHRVHRLVVERTEGRKLGPREMALHSCNNPSCIDPKHLRAGGAQDNMDDRHKADRYADKLGAGAHIVRHIRHLYASQGNWYKQKRRRYSHRKLGETFGLAHQTVGEIVRGEIWCHV